MTEAHTAGKLADQIRRRPTGGIRRVRDHHIGILRRKG